MAVVEVVQNKKKIMYEVIILKFPRIKKKLPEAESVIVIELNYSETDINY